MNTMFKLIFLTFLITSNLSCSSIKNHKIPQDKYELSYYTFENSDSLKIYLFLTFNDNKDKKDFTIHKKFYQMDFETPNSKDKYTIKGSNMADLFQGKFPITENIYTNRYVFLITIPSSDLHLASHYKTFQGQVSNNIYTGKIKFTFNTNYGKIQEEITLNQLFKQLDFNSDGSLKLFPIIEEKSDKIIFNLFALRLRPNTGEYAPTSENYRVEMTDRERGSKWNSSDGLNFLQMIGKVEPEEIGSYKIFSLDYSLKNKKYNINGNNEVTFIIPAKPLNYTIKSNYWKK